MNNLKMRLSHNTGALIAFTLFIILYVFYSSLHPRGFTSDLFVQNSNEAMALILVAMAQTLVVILGGIDLSVGSLMTMVNAVASEVVIGSGWEIFFGIVFCMIVGLCGGLLNGVIIVYGRLQPIVVTLATGAVFTGIALLIRPRPGGEVDGDLSWVATSALSELPATYGWWTDPPGWFSLIAGIPMPLVILAVIVCGIWIPYRSSEIGRGTYAIGSNEAAAYMSGVRINRSKLAAYALSGLFAGLAGLYFAVQTGSGNADPIQAGTYTLNSIAAVVIGGASLMGGTGGVIGTIFGVMVLRSITFCFRVVDTDSVVGFLANPLLQPMFEGLILVIAVTLGAARAFSVKNRLNMFG
ncbi:MAG: ABC transporter permease [Bauldia litoralis]